MLQQYVGAISLACQLANANRMVYIKSEELCTTLERQVPYQCQVAPRSGYVGSKQVVPQVKVAQL